MKLIAFVGPKGSGKDTCAAIAKEAGLVAGKVPFAGPLKRICSEVFAIDPEVFEHPLKKEVEAEFDLTHDALSDIVHYMMDYIPLPPWQAEEVIELFQKHEGVALTSPRHVLQYVGTEIIRSYDTDWHCKAAFSQLHLNQLGVTPGGVYAVTDCRFLNEHAFLSEKHDTEFIYVSRPEAEALLAQATHKSELEIADVRKRIGHTIFNNGTLDELTDNLLGWDHLYYAAGRGG